MKDPGKVRDFVLAAREAGRLVAAEHLDDGLDGSVVVTGRRSATDLFDWQDDD